jgi:hypothetical protein
MGYSEKAPIVVHLGIPKAEFDAEIESRLLDKEKLDLVGKKITVSAVEPVLPNLYDGWLDLSV